MNTQLFIISIVLGFSLLGLGQAFTAQAELQKECEQYDDGTFSCIGDKVLKVDKYLEGKTVYCIVIDLSDNTKCELEVD